MHPLLQWLIVYFLPISVTLVLLRTPHTKSSLREAATIHLGLLASIVLSQYFISQTTRSFPFHTAPVFLVLVAITAVLCTRILGKFGLLYILSAFLQELCLLSATHLLLSSLPMSIILLLVIIPYSLAHITSPIHCLNWEAKLPITLLAGTASVLLYAQYSNLYVNTVMHAGLGTLLIYSGILYHKTDFKIRRKLDPLTF